MKTREQIVDGIYRILVNELQHPHLDTFQSDSRFREDLAVDSSSILELLVLLELDLGLSLPEEAVMEADFETVRSMAKTLFDAQERTNPDRLLEYEEDIKLHCFVSCLSEVIKRHDLDQRMLYFGVWDSEVTISDEYVISYHSETISHQFFLDWYERLYGIEVESWYDPERSKEENAQTFERLVNIRGETDHIMVMLDMYLLPERVNEFNKNPFPHYLMVGPTPFPDQWMIYDPDYRWEGVTKKDRILHAMRQPSVAGGYRFTENGVRSPRNEDIRAYFEACIRPRENPMTDAVRQCVQAHLDGRDKNGELLPLAQVGSALDEIPILSIRKYAYEHGFAFFWRELELEEEEFDHWCEVIDALAKTYKLVQFQAKKLGATEQRLIGEKIFSLLDEQDTRERQIKDRMVEVFERWCREVVADSGVVLTEAAS